MGLFFTSDSSLSIKMEVYRATVFNAGLSATEVLIGFRSSLSRNDLAPGQRFIQRTLRTAMGGAATKKITSVDENRDEVVKYEAMDNMTVLRKCRVPPLYLEARVRRLLWFFQCLGTLSIMNVFLRRCLGAWLRPRIRSRVTAGLCRVALTRGCCR